jgi:hypothetical protein
MTTETAFTFRASRDTPHMVQEPSLCQSILTVSDLGAPGMEAIGVTVNGAPRRFRRIDSTRLCVSPLIPFECDRVTVHMTGPTEGIALRCFDASTAPAALPRYHPSPSDGYGFQGRQDRISNPLASSKLDCNNRRNHPHGRTAWTPYQAPLRD